MRLVCFGSSLVNHTEQWDLVVDGESGRLELYIQINV